MAALKQVRKNGKTVWRARATYIDPATGKQRSLTRFRGTKWEAAEAGRVLDDEVARILGVYAARGCGTGRVTTVKELWEMCMEHWRSEHCAPSTIANKERAWKRFAPMIGHLKLGQLQEVVTDRVVQDLLHDGRWKWSTVRITVDEIRAMLQLAKRWQIMDRIPDVRRVTARRVGVVPGAAHEKGLTAEQTRSLLLELEKLPNRVWHAIASFQLLTGCRVGEALGLRFEDITQEVVVIANSWSSDRRELGPTKGRKKNAIPMSPPLRELLAPWTTFKKSGFVFENRATGNPYSRPSYADALRAAAEAAKIPKKVTTHTLRHTVGRLVGLETGSPIAVMRILGHSSLAISKGYIGGEDEQKAIATDVMAKLISGT